MQLLLDLGANEVDHGEVSQLMDICDIILVTDSLGMRRPEMSVTSP